MPYVPKQTRPVGVPLGIVRVEPEGLSIGNYILFYPKRLTDLLIYGIILPKKYGRLTNGTPSTRQAFPQGHDAS